VDEKKIFSANVHKTIDFESKTGKMTYLKRQTTVVENLYNSFSAEPQFYRLALY